MLEKPTFNTLINHVVFTMDNLLKDKSYSDDLRQFLYLIATGMILSYGDEYLDDIYNLLSTVKFKDIKNVKDSKILSYVNPTNHNYLSKLFNVNCTFPTVYFDYELLYTNVDSSNIKTLEYLVHELNYIFFNKNKKYSIINSIKIRYDYYRNDIDIEDECSSTFNRIFNVLQSEDIIKRILDLNNYDISNIKLKKALEKIDDIDSSIYKFEGLDMLVNLFRPLYRFKDTKRFIDNSMFYDNNLIEKEFDDILGKNSYKKVCKNLDSLSGMIYDQNTRCNYYALSIEYVAIRNDFVKKYIDRRYLNKA